MITVRIQLAPDESIGRLHSLIGEFCGRVQPCARYPAALSLDAEGRLCVHSLWLRDEDFAAFCAFRQHLYPAVRLEG